MMNLKPSILNIETSIKHNIWNMEKKYIDFVKYLEKSKLIKKGSYKSEQVMNTIKEVCNLSEEDAKKETSPAVQMIYAEWTDWVERNVK